MKTLTHLTLTALLLVSAPGAQAAMPACDGPASTSERAALGLSITTASPAARALVEAGLGAYWAGDSAAALQAFRLAQSADPNCAMCHWGEALALGPRVHSPMQHARVRPAWEAIIRAQSLARDASAAERDLIDATRHRYGVNPMVLRGQLDHAWATVVRQLAEDRPDAAALWLLLREAEAILELGPDAAAAGG